MQNLTMNSDSCIDTCLRCAKVCWQFATNHCLQKGGKHLDPDHYRLMLNCADICRMSAEFQLSSSPYSDQLCALCAEVCEACAHSCEILDDMDECVAACRICAASCQEMAKINRQAIAQ